MSTSPIGKPSAASESFITALAILFFASLAILFMWLDNKKYAEKHAQNINQQVKETSLRQTENPTNTVTTAHQYLG